MTSMTSTTSTTSTISTIKALVVDDDPLILELLQLVLELEGYTVVTASDGEQALRQWDTEQPDLVLLDIGLPGMDGYEVCRRLRQRDPLHTSAIMMLTARVSEADELRGLSVGADDYMTKPFDCRQLPDRLRAVLSGDRDRDAASTRGGAA